jgi:hypothetical protein
VEFAIKNIVLYDGFGNVIGFAEFKIRRDRTDIKVRHNLFLGSKEVGEDERVGLLFGVLAEGHPEKVFVITGAQSFFEIRGRLNPEKEIFVRLGTRGGDEWQVLASGIVNQTKVVSISRTTKVVAHEDDATEDLPVVADRVEAVEELNEALRHICIIDEEGRGQCDGCPYREYFFEKALEEEEVVI